MNKWVNNNRDYISSGGNVEDSLPAGVYKYIEGMTGCGVRLVDSYTDDLIMLESDSGPEVISEINKFWESRDKFESLGVLWKRGVMLWGPPGSGKTAITQYISNWAVSNDCIVFNPSCSYSLREGLSVIRDVEKDRPVIVVIEEIDNYEEGELLPILDGANQYGNILYLATTNYPENLSSRLTNRPSRFDKIVYVDFPCEKARDEFLKKKSKILAGNDVERKKWVVKTENMSMAHLKELIISVECLGKSFDEAIGSIVEMRVDKKTSGKWEEKLSSTTITIKGD